MFKLLFFMSVFMSFSAIASANSCVVLVYHHFSDKTPKSTSISPELFEQQLQYLQQQNFSVLPLETMLSRLKAKTLPEKCVVLTADDAYQSIADNAYPLLKKYQMPLAVFVATDASDQRYQAMMSWQQMRDIQGDTIQFYNHSSSHGYLLDLDQAQLADEIQHAQKRLQTVLGVEKKIFAYPYGEASLPMMEQVKDLGYIAFGQHSGVVSGHSDLQYLPRFPMAAHFAKMSSFETKVHTLPMPIKPQRVDPILKQNPPVLELLFTRALSKHEKANFNCFASGGVTLTWHGNARVKIVAKKPLAERRSKYNCTMPSGEKGRYYWYSIQWINRKLGGES